MAAIEAVGLTRDFGSLRAVDHLDLSVPEGSIFGYLGPNGAGKTTTLHMLLGILKPTSGTAHVAGIDVAKDPTGVRRHCGALLEHNGLYERLSAQDNLEFYARLYGMVPAERAPRIREVLEANDLWDRRKERVGTWSRGMKQRLAIGRALLHRPSVVFLDEPTAGFDPAAAAKLRSDVKHLVKELGTTVFLTTHNLHEAQELCDRVAVLRQGRLLAVGPPDHIGSVRPTLDVRASGIEDTLVASLRRRKDIATVERRDGGLRIELASTGRGPAIIKALVTGGAELEEVRRTDADLEASFLSLLEAKT